MVSRVISAIDSTVRSVPAPAKPLIWIGLGLLAWGIVILGVMLVVRLF